MRIGQGLFSVNKDPFHSDPAAIVWCKPMDVAISPLK
jgi:hypothetical protein